MASATPKGGSAVQRLQARTAPIAVQKGGEVEIPLDKIRFDSTQPRQSFHHPDGQVDQEDQQALQELAETIKSDGLIQAITVEPVGDGTFRVLVGERRTRAHMLLGKATIRATIREDVADKTDRRLLLQLVENVARKDLPDADMARSIRKLMDGSPTAPPMTQAQIAAALGKSEGYVSRFVRFGDEELQRLWVQTGIADTVEHVYRLSILPMPLQVEVQRRVNLAESHPDFIAKPIARSVLEELTKLGKIAKAADKAGRNAPTAGPGVQNSADQVAANPAHGTVGVEDVAGDPQDPVAEALAQAAAAGHEGQADASSSAPSANTLGTAYQLPDSQRASILAGANATPDAEHPSSPLPPVSIRGNFGSLVELLKQLDKADAKAAANLPATISLPAPIAQRLANTITGNVVESRAVAAEIHRHLSGN